MVGGSGGSLGLPAVAAVRPDHSPKTTPALKYRGCPGREYRGMGCPSQVLLQLPAASVRQRLCPCGEKGHTHQMTLEFRIEARARSRSPSAARSAAPPTPGALTAVKEKLDLLTTHRCVFSQGNNGNQKKSPYFVVFEKEAHPPTACEESMNRFRVNSESQYYVTHETFPDRSESSRPLL